MGVRILVGREQGSDVERAVLFDSVTGLAFGPLFDDEEEADDFLGWFARTRAIHGGRQRDVRCLSSDEVAEARADFLRERQGQTRCGVCDEWFERRALNEDGECADCAEARRRDEESVR